MQRHNAAKALRSDAKTKERWQHALGRVTQGLEDGLLERRTTDDRGSSFFDVFERSFLTGTGTALREPAGAVIPEDDSGPPPAFWSPKTDVPAMFRLIKSSPINLLLVLVPLGFFSKELGFSDTTTFVLNFVGIIPLALILGDVTEDLALRCGEVIGGLVNATFGNVVELILSCVALTAKSKKLNNVAGLSNLGSVLSNLLLVLGCCFLFGGLCNKVQYFNSKANQVSNSLLFLAVVGLILPCVAPLLPDVTYSGASILYFSRAIAVLLLIAYICYLYFQLVSHNSLFLPEEDSAGQGAGDAADNGSAEHEEAEQPVLTITAELGILLLISVIVAVASEKITGSIEGMAEGSGLSENFLSLVLLPLAGNAVEHITAVMVAIKNKMDLALAIAIGSSIQIAIFVLPTCVIYAWTIGNDFSLELDPLGTLSLAVAIIHANFITSGGSSHYLMGVQLICTYLIISAAFLF